MSKTILIIIEVLAFVCIVGHIMEGEHNYDPITLNAPWIILVLCAGFYGVIETIEKRSKK